MTSREMFEKKTEANPINPGIDIYRVNYIEYLEEQIKLMLEALEALDIDNHVWSTRPCPTCQKITELINKPFRCNRKAINKVLGEFQTECESEWNKIRQL